MSFDTVTASRTSPSFETVRTAFASSAVTRTAIGEDVAPCRTALTTRLCTACITSTLSPPDLGVLQIDVDPVSRSGGFGLHELDRRRRRFSEIHVLQIIVIEPARTCQLQQSGEELLGTGRRCQSSVHRDLGPLGYDIVQERGLERGPDARKRSPQLMRGVGDEAVLLLERRVQTLQHVVDGVAEVPNLVARPREREPLVEVLARDALCELRELCHPSERAPRHEPHRETRKGDHDDGGDGRNQHHRVGQVMCDSEHRGRSVELVGPLPLRGAAGGGVDRHLHDVLQHRVLGGEEHCGSEGEGRRGHERQLQSQGALLPCCLTSCHVHTDPIR